MARVTCFRCDWEGETDGDTCPSCGTPLYRPSPRSEGASPPPSPTPSARPSPRAEFLPVGEPAEGVASRPPRTSHAFAAFAVLAAVATGALWWFLRAHEVPVGVQATSPPPNGHLVYTTAGSGGARLWSWDPRTGAATEGPAVEGKVVQLVSAQGALAGWLGVTTRNSEDLLEASILRSQAPDAQPAKIFTADLVAWGPNGASVVSAGLGSPTTTSGCYAKLAVYREELDTYTPGAQAPVYRHTQFCGEIPTLGQTLASTYFTWVREDGTGIFFLGNGDPHEVLHGWSLLSVSPTSDLLVQPAEEQGAALFWRGADRPDPYHGADGSPVIVREVLTWTIGADAALVSGTVEGHQGLYLLDTTPGGTRVPRYVGVARSPVFATAAFDGSLYIATEYRVLVYHDQHLFEVTLPEGAPRPDGPIAWMPG